MKADWSEYGRVMMPYRWQRLRIARAINPQWYGNTVQQNEALCWEEREKAEWNQREGKDPKPVEYGAEIRG